MTRRRAHLDLFQELIHVFGLVALQTLARSFSGAILCLDRDGGPGDGPTVERELERVRDEMDPILSDGLVQV